MDSARKKACYLHLNLYKFLPTTQPTQEKVVASRSDCEHGDRESIVGSVAFLYMMSTNAFALGEKATVTHKAPPRHQFSKKSRW